MLIFRYKLSTETFGYTLVWWWKDKSPCAR